MEQKTFDVVSVCPQKNNTTIELFKHQHDFVTDIDHRYVALRAGYGAGKTFAFCMKAIHLASLNVGHQGILCEPTNDLVNTVLIPSMEEALETAGIPYTLKRAPMPELTMKFAHGETKVLLRSGENFQRLIGLNLAFVGVDELDTIQPNVAKAMWKKLQGRMRKGNVYQMFTTSTPEGFRFMYKFFIQDPIKDEKKKGQIRVIHASSYDNPTLPPEFLQDLELNYSDEEKAALLHGQFVNMAAGRIYYKFDRRYNDCNISIDSVRSEFKDKKDFYNRPLPLPQLHIGMDFNVGKMAAIVHIIDEKGPVAIDEILGARDTEQMIQLIKERYPDFKSIAIYPDSSGRGRATVDASTSDLNMLTQAGFQVNVGNTNPPVKDRINSMNQAFCDSSNDRKYRVNVSACPQYTQALEQQVYDKQGQPDKQHDTDHPNDAAGYFIYSKFPIKRYNSGGLRLAGY